MISRADANTSSANGYSVSDSTATNATSSYQVQLNSQSIETRTVKTPDGGSTQSALQPNGNIATTFADGTTEVDSVIPDALWTSYLPYVATSVLKLPQSGVQRTLVSSKQVNYQATTPPTVDKVVETITQNSNPAFVSSFKASTKTYTITTPGDLTETVVVDDLGRPQAVTVPGIDTVNYFYDSYGRLSSVTQGTRQNGNGLFPVRFCRIRHPADHYLVGVGGINDHDIRSNRRRPPIQRHDRRHGSSSD